MFYNDEGHEFNSTFLGAHLLQCGPCLRKSCIDTQAPNGVAECKHRNLNETTRCILLKG